MTDTAGDRRHPDARTQRQHRCERPARVVATPPRHGIRRLINPWAYRHLRAFGVTHIAGRSVAAAAAAACLRIKALP